MNDPTAPGRFGFRMDYLEAMATLVRRFLHETDANLVLVPHVNPSAGTHESDPVACERVAATVGADHRQRVLIAPAYADPCQAKGLIRRFDWFAGMRMHATIAALSTGTPAAAVAYSSKTAGVFERCGVGPGVVDARQASTDDAVRALWASWLDRERTRQTLAASLPAIRRELDETFDDVVHLAERAASTRSRA